MGAGGSYHQAITDPEEGKAEEEEKGTRKLMWADCDDNEEGRQEAAEEEWHKAGKEKREERGERDARRKEERGKMRKREESEETARRETGG